MIDLGDMTQEKFLRRVRVDENGCWLWTGTVQHNGYGTFHLGGRKGKDTRAHRLSWALWRGQIPDGLFVCHRCDVRRCVNPEHLFLGTGSENMRDAASKGRLSEPHRKYPRGAAASAAKLNEYAVRLVRESLASTTLLARAFDVSRSTIVKIRQGETWCEEARSGG